ncbi:MAG TPA: family 20 glycosylhydrolase [Usitatibacter sp.]|nr:family 20 glycosylhydrolase [Usitatibacter sp.]
MHRAFLAACALTASAATAAEPPVVPRPLTLVTMKEGPLRLSASLPVVAPASDPGAQRAAQWLVQLVERSHKVKLRVVPEASGRAIRFKRMDDSSLGEEGYRLTAWSGMAVVSAKDDAGLVHGATTLWQLVATGKGGLAVPPVDIVDMPRFRWRGILLDSARHYQSPEFLHAFIDWMAVHKLNVLHWHLTDDQAWRLEIRKYPRLTQVGAWRVPAGAARDDIDNATGKPRLYGGYYSQETVRALVRHAAERGITVVPEIEMPGHATAAAVAYPELAAAPIAGGAVPADWGVYPNVYSLEEPTFAFIEDVLDEVMALFPSRFIHVGGDEVERGQWLDSPRGKARMVELGIDDPARLQPYFTQRIGRFLHARGRRLVGWDEILEPGLPVASVVMSWRGTEGAVKAAKLGFDTVLAAHPTLYFDNRQSALRSEPPGRARVVSLEDVYAFEPMPAGLSREESAHVLGLQGNLWTEHIRTEERLASMAFPRAAAIAELGWSPPERRGFSDFRSRLDALMRHYGSLGLAAAARMDESRRKPATAAAALVRTSHELRLCSDNISLGLEDDAPPRGTRAVFVVDIQNPCWIYPAVALDKLTAVEATVGQVPFNFQIGEEVKKIRFATPTTPAGELEVRLDTCEGDLLARLPLAPAARSHGVTTLPRSPLARRSGVHDLCLRFAQHGVDPLWTLDTVRLLERAP